MGAVRHRELIVRVRTALCATAALATLNSCAVHGTVGREDLLARPTVSTRYDHFGKPPGQGVRSYRTTDGVVHEFEGKAWVDGDSVVFERTNERHRVALANLTSVVAEETDAARTFFLALGLGAVAFGVWFVHAISQME